MIELLVVIVILGILSVIGLGSFSSSQMKARDSKRKTDLRAISDALEVYYNDFGNYPLADGTGFMQGCGADGEQVCTAGTIWQTDNGTTYMVQIPEDPSGGKYYYLASPTGSHFQLYAHLENDRDRDVPKDLNDEPLSYANPEAEEGSNACIIGDCNYAKTSTNIDAGATF